ncbi:MAG: transcription termination factor NusA [Oscillospiraceae bacterium]|nr:transcription termination factor NusA [Oscillospiraceae bacterium]
MNNKAFFEAINTLASEHGIPPEILIDKIGQGVLKAVKKEYPDCDEFAVNIDLEKNKFEVCVMRTVVDDEPIDMNEINIEDAKVSCTKKAKLGDIVPYKLSTAQFGRVAAQYAKQSIRHDIKEYEREKIINQYKDKEHEAVSAVVQKVEPDTGNCVLTIEKGDAYLFKNEQIPGEVLTEGDIIKVYVIGISNPEKKPSVKISRTHKDLVRRLFELEVPEINEGIVDVRAISREAGARTKVAVCSNDENVDPVGACIGSKHSRIEKIIKELNGEKIDIIVYDEDPAVFISHALSPADVVSVTIVDAEERICTVIVPNNQISLAIGNKGQNAKLAARLTGYKIDIRPENPVQ